MVERACSACSGGAATPGAAHQNAEEGPVAAGLSTAKEKKPETGFARVAAVPTRLAAPRLGRASGAAASASVASASSHSGDAGAATPLPQASGALLGRGVFSETYVASHDERVAVKVTKPFDAGGATKMDLMRGKMVLRELRVARALGHGEEHPNVVRLLGLRPRAEGVARRRWCRPGAKSAGRRGSGIKLASGITRPAPLVCLLTYERATTDLQRLVNSSLLRQRHRVERRGNRHAPSFSPVSSACTPAAYATAT